MKKLLQEVLNNQTKMINKIISVIGEIGSTNTSSIHYKLNKINYHLERNEYIFCNSTQELKKGDLVNIYFSKDLDPLKNKILARKASSKSILTKAYGIMDQDCSENQIIKVLKKGIIEFNSNSETLLKPNVFYYLDEDGKMINETDTKFFNLFSENGTYSSNPDIETQLDLNNNFISQKIGFSENENILFIDIKEPIIFL